VASASHAPVIAALALTIVPLAIWSAVRHTDDAARARDLAERVPQAARPGYATSNRCEACHPSQYHSWHRGFHRSMTQYASPATVRGDFADVALDGGGYTAKLSRRGDDFFVAMPDPLWQYQVDTGQRAAQPGEVAPTVERRISMVTGSHHMQAYWVAGNEGNTQLSLPFTYLFDDRRWVPRGDVFLHPPDEDRHGEQVWNVSCIRCHTTAGQPLALGGGWQLHTRLGENGIACEACHGPGEAHIAANQNPVRRYVHHLRGGGDPTIVNPARLPAARAAEVCGQCHSLTEVSEQIELGTGKAYVAGDELEKTMPLLRAPQVSPEIMRKNYFWADGTIRVSSRDYSGLVESKCMTSGTLWCGSCHSMHDSDPVNLLAAGKATNAACTSCHPAIAADVPAHTHHKAASTGSSCFNCHMPHTVYGLLKGIRNHRIDSPHVTGETSGDARPNACNLCHVDRSLAWAADRLTAWYRQPRPALALALADDDPPAAVRWLLAGDAVQRAVSAWHFGWDAVRGAADPALAVPYVLSAMSDPYAAVRYVAGHAIAQLVPGAVFDYLAAPDVRQQQQQAILQRWLAAHPQSSDQAAAINARITQLIDQRDNTPVRAME
jgi:predicted CXXCH cytochrome family protein